MRIRSAILLLLLAMSAWTRPVHAAESYDNCTGIISALPAVISSPGTWCLKQNLSTSNTIGRAILIQANDVVLDCNDFLLDGLSVGLGTEEFGIYALNQTHLTVRHCNIRGFFRGLDFEGAGGGHLVEDNHFLKNTVGGIRVVGNRTMVRRNLVAGTGGSTVDQEAGAIGVYGDDSDILDNQVIGVNSSDTIDNTLSGISVGVGSGTTATNLTIEGNEVKGLVSPAATSGAGIVVASGSGRVTIRSNDVENTNAGNGFGIECSAGPAASQTRVRDNVIEGFATAIANCADAGENDVSH